MIGFGFTSDWSRNWCKFLRKSLSVAMSLFSWHTCTGWFYFLVCILHLTKIIHTFLFQEPKKQRKKLVTWSVDDVCSWLTSLDLELYCESFRQNAIDGVELSNMTGEVLASDLGIGEKHYFQLFSQFSWMGSIHLLQLWLGKLFCVIVKRDSCCVSVTLFHNFLSY